MTILGINTESDGFGAAVLRDGRVLAAIEQFKIRQHWSSMDKAPVPKDAILTALQAAGTDCSEVGAIALTGDVNSAEKIIPHIRKLGLNPRAMIEPVDLQTAHVTAAFAGSPFDRAAILILNCGREPGSLCLAAGDGARIEIEKIPRRYSLLGPVYSSVSSALGFQPWTCSKMAWLGATGQPEFLDVFHHMMPSDHAYAPVEELVRAVDLNRPQDAAASLQAWTNEIVTDLAEGLCRRHSLSNICVAGHLAENPFLIRELEKHFGAERVFVPPAPGRESLSIGAAWVRSRRERRFAQNLCFPYPALGPEFADPQIKEEMDNCKLVCNFFPGVDALAETVCRTLNSGGLAGWFQGRCEFGHRALGFRSILANPFTPFIDENINRFLKHRETSHPFVISVPEESASEYFDQPGANARTIASMYPVRMDKSSLLSRFVIQDECVRVHTVSSADNHPLWMLLHRMKGFTGHPLLINTSFNLPSEPLVMTPRDAIRSFYASGLDVLAIGRFLLTK
ncbi:MAG TPA: carbamoyltransferase C-terminal domain-containing protein [Terriglobia bacterium]|jgi:carbamoyltransferase